MIQGFIPTALQTFEVLQAQQIAGSFANAANGQRLTTADGIGSFVVNYGSGSAFDPKKIVLSSFQLLQKPGDFDLDGDVDGADFLRWQQGQSPNPLSPTDLAHWRSRFATAESATLTAPEPAANFLAAMAVLALASGRRMQRA